MTNRRDTTDNLYAQYLTILDERDAEVERSSQLEAAIQEALHFATGPKPWTVTRRGRLRKVKEVLNDALNRYGAQTGRE